MITPDRLKPDQRIKVEIYDTSGNLVGEQEITGVHTIDEAIGAVASLLPPGTAPNDYVYRVTDLSDGTSERYMLNAHNHPRLIT